jgi:hypothetical protein
LVVIVSSQHKDCHFGTQTFYPPCCLNAVDTGHSDIDNGNIRLQFASQPCRFSTIACLADNFNVWLLFQDAPCPLSDKGMVIGN